MKIKIQANITDIVVDDAEEMELSKLKEKVKDYCREGKFMLNDIRLKADYRDEEKVPEEVYNGGVSNDQD